MQRAGERSFLKVLAQKLAPKRVFFLKIFGQGSPVVCDGKTTRDVCKQFTP